MKKQKNKNLRLLTQGDAIELSKGVRLKKSENSRRSDNLDLFFDNLIIVEELTTVFRDALQIIRNRTIRGNISPTQIRQRNFSKKRVF